MRKGFPSVVCALVLFTAMKPCLSTAADTASTESLCRLIVVLEDFRNDTGQAAISVFNHPRGFPDNPRHAFLSQLLPIRDGKARAVFESIPYGRYAIGVLHDENGNQRMDKSFFGFPREGFGVSGTGHTFRSTPRFEDALMEITSPTLRLKITLHYLRK
jgi:uncharacterized protein (DUF2141 family)